MRLFLFTGSYPYAAAAEGTFLPQELKVLSECFEDIVLVPLSTEGEREAVELLNVTVDTTFASFRRSRGRKWLALLKAVPTPAMVEELLRNGSILLRHPSALKRAIVHMVQAEVTRDWMRRRSRVHRGERSIIYTWWFDAPALGLVRLARETGDIVVTRAHGYDLYEARHTPAYIPFRRSALHHIDFVYADSRAGVAHLRVKYPEYRSKIGFSPLGVEDPGFSCASSSDAVFRIVSCSFLTPVKRIDLLIRGLACLGSLRSDARVSWVHIGEGPEKDALASLAARSLPPNIRPTFLGYPGKQGVYDYYRRHAVDLFVNVSQSEGTPVSVMEAISLGIPILCTSVGGNVELAGPENGMLLSPNPTPEEIATGIMSLMDARANLGVLRAGSRKVWNERYNARKNYTAFARSVRELGGATVPGTEGTKR